MKRSALTRSRPLTAKGTMKTCGRDGCAETFYCPPSRLGQRYCSPTCAYADRGPQPVEANAARRRAMAGREGAANPNHRHGLRVGEHLRGWNVAAKGEPRCRVCPNAAVDLHHAIPRSVCPPAARRDLRNGLPLCKSCHTKWHRHTLAITRDVFTEDEWTYLSTLKLTGRETDAWLDDHYPTRKDTDAA